MATMKLSRSKSSAPTKNALVCEASPEPSASRARHSALGSKKAEMTPALEATLIMPEQPETVELELDEMWSFVRCKARKLWIWLAVCKHTRQVVACVIGGRGIATCKKLWDNVPEAYKQATAFSDFWEAYQAVIPDEQHQPVGKDSGLTAHVERFNNTLRQRLARFVRKTLSFSKSQHMHLICLHLFLVRYNRERAAICCR